MATKSTSESPSDDDRARSKSPDAGPAEDRDDLNELNRAANEAGAGAVRRAGTEPPG